VGADVRARAHGRAREHAGAAVEGGALLDADRCGDEPLLADGALGVAAGVLEVDQDDAVVEPAARADRDVLMGGDDAALAEAGLGADLDVAGADVEAAALLELRPGADRQPRAGRDVEAHAGPERDAGPQRDAPAAAQSRGQRAQSRAAHGGHAAQR
jgi:hypothetical protein